ncbi:MAG: ABC transporter ATP-binding protein [Rhodospirillaceae bacterium]
MTVMVEVDHLSKTFGALTAVDGISLTVSKGEVLGFLGPNGAGKTTTMRMIAGFLQPSAGTARVCGRDVVAEPKAVKSIIGYMPEGSPSYDDMSVGGFLKFIAEVRGFTGADRKSRVEQVAARVGLTDVLEKPIDILSKGYRRRVGLAQAIIHDPPVLILDEPTDGLDPNQKHQVRTLIEDMAAEKAIIISTHILEEVQAVCTRAVIIGRGRVLADGTADQLLTMLPDHTAVCVVVPEAAAAGAAATLRALQGVAAVFETPLAGGRTKLRLTPRGANSLIGEVGAAVRSNAIPAIEIYQDGGSLDDVFRLITTGTAGATAAAA